MRTRKETKKTRISKPYNHDIRLSKNDPARFINVSLGNPRIPKLFGSALVKRERGHFSQQSLNPSSWDEGQGMPVAYTIGRTQFFFSGLCIDDHATGVEDLATFFMSPNGKEASPLESLGITTGLP